MPQFRVAIVADRPQYAGGTSRMSQQINAPAAEEAPATGIAPAQSSRGWTLVEDAPAPEIPLARDRAGAARGMVLLLLGGGFFWGAVAAALWALNR